LKASTHEAPFWQGVEEHSSSFVSHKTPENPAKHLQENELMESRQEAPLRQGLDEHSLIFD
jgi:hypothetical protein